MRLEDESATVRDLYPEEHVDLAVFITELGASSTLMFVLAMCFWLTRRRETALVISYAFAGAAFIVGLKAILALPRPPEELFVIALDGDEYGFPSGHTFAATIVYGGLVSAFERMRDPRIVAGTTVLVVLVGLSRIVLGFHYLGDVIVGALLGVVFVVSLETVTRGDPRRGFAVATLLALPAVAVTGLAHGALIALGGGIGGLLVSAYHDLEALPPLRSPLEGVVLSVGGAGFVVGVLALESVLGGFDPAVVALYAVVVVGILLAPAAVGRLQWNRLE